MNNQHPPLEVGKQTHNQGPGFCTDLISKSSRYGGR